MYQLLTIIGIICGCVFLISGVVYGKGVNKTNNFNFGGTVLSFIILFSFFGTIGFGILGALLTPRCPICYKTVTTQYCTYCGWDIDEKVTKPTCPECGKEADTPYCGFCGTKIEED